jgi:hypothetical protein
MVKANTVRNPAAIACFGVLSFFLFFSLLARTNRKQNKNQLDGDGEQQINGRSKILINPADVGVYSIALT